MAKSRKIEELEEHMHEEEEEEENNDNDEQEEESMTDDEMINKEIEVNFEARTPDDSDFHGIRRLLQQLFLKAHIDLSELSELIIKQNFVCSVIKQEIDDDNDEDEDMDDEDFGMITVVNITEKKELNCIKHIWTFFENHCKNSGSEGKKLLSVLEDPNAQIGLILSERFMNIPPKIALPLYENLRMDIKKAVDKKMKFDLSHFLLISKIYQQRTGKKEKDKEESIIYANAEDEFFSEEADLQFDFSVANESDSVLAGGWKEDDSEWKPFRKVILIPALKLDNVIQKLQSEFS